MSGSQKDEYIMHSNEEVVRLRKNHAMIKSGANGQLVFAPIDWTEESKTVLDSAGADGFWMLDLKQSLPKDAKPIKAIVTDLIEDYFPKGESKPPDVEFRKQDIGDPWPAEWAGKFDLVHQRLGLASSPNKAGEIVKAFFHMTRPNGWIQLGEMPIPPEAAIEGNQRRASDEFFVLVRAVVSTFSDNSDFATKSIHHWIEQAGYVDVAERTVESGVGKLQQDPDLQESSIEAFVSGLHGLLQYVKSLNPMPPALEKIDLNTLIERWTEEARQEGVIFPMRYVWGRRPAA